MAEWLGSALVQEVVSRGATFGLARCEEKASQGHLKERLEMAANKMELALERSAKRPITDVSLLQRRKMIERGYDEAMELLNKCNQQAVSARQELLQVAQGVKRKRWVICANSMSLKPLVALSTDDVRRFEWFADRAGKFVRDVESGCSLHHYNFCSPIVRHLLEGKTLLHYFEQGNLRRSFYVQPTYSDERGAEAVLLYNYVDSTMTQKNFFLVMALRLSESTDIVGVAIKGLQLFASEFKLAAECAMGELTLLSNSQDIANSYRPPPWSDIIQGHIECAHCLRPDPACCIGRRHGLCGNNNVSSELSDIFPEQVIYWGFHCYLLGRSNGRGGGKPPLLLIALFGPHDLTAETQNSYAIETIGDVKGYRDASIQQVVQAIKSDAINCFFHQPELKRYDIVWLSKHGAAFFTVENANTERTGGPKTRSRYNTRGSTGRSRRR